MKKLIDVYDPPMCCSTGVCGTDVDPKLVRFAGDLAWIAGRGVAVRRFNLAQQPADFASNPAVAEALKASGNACLPLIAIDGAIATRSIYPTREQLAELAGLDAPARAETDAGSCCGGTGSSCCG
jgi:hypothetical protein